MCCITALDYLTKLIVKKRDFSKVCRSEGGTNKRPSYSTASLLGLEPDCYNLTHLRVNQKVTINGREANALDTGLTLSYLSKRFSNF